MFEICYKELLVSTFSLSEMCSWTWGPLDPFGVCAWDVPGSPPTERQLLFKHDLAYLISRVQANHEMGSPEVERAHKLLAQCHVSGAQSFLANGDSEGIPVQWLQWLGSVCW